MEDISFREAERIFHVQRCDYLPVEYDIFEIGCKSCQGIHHSISKCFPLLVVPAALNVVRGVLYKTGHNMFTRRRHVRIEDGGENNIDVRLAGKITVFCIIISFFDIVNVR